MVKQSETELKMLVKGGEKYTVELKSAARGAADLAERLCGMATARGGTVIIGVEDSTHKLEERTFENLSAKNKGFR